MTSKSLGKKTSDLKEIAELCKSSGDPLRLEVLRALKTDSYSVLELCDIFDVKQSSMSHHLKVLATANAVTTRREGNSIFYRRALPQQSKPSGRLLQALYQSVDASKLPDATSER
ncbi:MAG: winged helix-turn-helix transcriptional regulator, partial [Pseudomonadales bacterium]|nr:winged helix-turn-helix transcriptional regulator [Pseudomonadales bacterium]